MLRFIMLSLAVFRFDPLKTREQDGVTNRQVDGETVWETGDEDSDGTVSQDTLC